MMLRIAAIGDYLNYYSYFLYGVMEGAIRCGAWFRPISLFGNTLEDVRRQVNVFKPNIILCHCIFNKEPHSRDEIFDTFNMFRKRYGSVVFYHSGDARTVPRYPDDISKIVDFCLVNHSNLKVMEDKWKVPCFFWPYACLYQPDISKANPKFLADVAFTGYLSDSGHHADRLGFINSIKERVNVRLYPDEDIVDTKFITDIISASSKAVLGYQMGNDIPGYVDVRPYQYIGSGAVYMQDRHHNIDSVFADGEHYVGFERGNVDSFIEMYEYYAIKNPDLGNEIRRSGFKYCQEKHSTAVRMRRVIDIYRKR
jgi:hypothetical protein